MHELLERKTMVGSGVCANEQRQLTTVGRGTRANEEFSQVPDVDGITTKVLDNRSIIGVTTTNGCYLIARRVCKGFSQSIWFAPDLLTTLYHLLLQSLQSVHHHETAFIPR